MSSSDITSKIYLEGYIQFHASEVTIIRGKELYKAEKVSYVEYDEFLDKRKFLVQGSLKYTVSVRGLKKQEIHTTCNCPFDKGGICKHVIASLLFIVDNQNMVIIKPMLTKLTLNRPQKTKVVVIPEFYEIPEYRKITTDVIKKHTSLYTFNKINDYYNQLEIRDIEIEDNVCTIRLKNNWQKEAVMFTYTDNKVLVKSTEKRDSNHLTPCEAQCFRLIANSPSSDLLEIIFSNGLAKKQAEIVKKYGLPQNTKFTKYFEYNFSVQTGLTFLKKKSAIGLVPIIGDSLPYALSIIEKNYHVDSALGSIALSPEKRELGFALSLVDFSGHNSYDGDQADQKLGRRQWWGPNVYRIIPIIGKSPKNGHGFSSNIDEYDSSSENYYQINKTKEGAEIVKLLDKIDEIDNITRKFDLEKQVFEKLADEKFTFRLINTRYGVKKSNLEPVSISAHPINISFEVTSDKEFNNADLKLKIENKLVDFNMIDQKRSDYKIYCYNNILHFVNDLSISRFLLNYPGPIKMVKAYKEEFYQKVLLPLSRNFEITFKDELFKLESVELDFNAKQVYLSEKNEYLVITPQVVYQNGVSAVLSNPGNVLTKQGDLITEYKRNFELEDQFVNMIADLHPNFAVQKDHKIFFLHHTEFTEDFWFYKFFESLHSDNVEIYGLKDLKNFKFSPYKGKIGTSVASGIDWFEVSVNISFGDNLVSLKDIKSAVVNRQKYIQLKDGSVGIIPSEWLHRLEKYFRNGEIKKDKLEISKLRFSIIDELFDNIDDAAVLSEIEEKRKRFANFTEISKTKAPKEIKADLRHYQVEGLNWLNFLHQMQWGGILADDMGLGKTLQILTFIQQLSNKKKVTSLIVVPTTLLFNWENEIKKFAPKLNALYHYGNERLKDTKDFKSYHLVFTTYGILLRDIEYLKDFAFDYVILDESQAIKNPASRRFKAATLLNAKNRIALSGTPIENGTFDLFSQMSFVNRGFFSNATNFRENYSNPIDKDGNEVVAAELQKLINPFVLRRTKEQVATELPDKTEDIIYCEMESGQRQVYDAYKNNYKDRLLSKIEDEGIGKSKLMVLEALTRLRQICDSPVLLKDDEISETQSVKIKELISHITEKTSNHKILVFSQFVEMLKLVKEELDKLSIEYEYLDGQNSTKQREQSVKNFEESDDTRVFLISLKAGGTGLNLIAADYVYLLDPWWNPAVENQAIDRCYRIGQNKKVFAYRMICKNTVEEKIMQLQSKKKKIASDIIQTDENIMKTIDIKDIKELFS